ncbi:ABC transporter ATP-binding protein [Ilyomonas limi]|uniref:ABC transporter ATP-binding protein n=1 Tax=Ilyomonas limi TaxID=2575867 RepID=A0A4U3L0I0_9BACT|nr:ABC transporter ATP-binding protein [Ilyomonas limi]TKK66976.1 ABC transporter ATP-binding protein [Ilyomonas limi]
MIEVQQLTKKYQQTVAVSNVSFTVHAGQTLVLLGTSGSGKTTTLRMINRLIEPTSGSIFINGKNILSQPPEILRRSIGYVLQGYGLFPHYTVAENIAIVPRLLKWNKGRIEQRTDELLHKLQLSPAKYRHVYPSQLSGGQMQRVGLARALAANPPILLMDEPFGALDPLTRTAVRKELKELDELKKKTIILVTHDVQEAFELGNIIGLMDKGCIQQLATPTELLFQPANDFVKQFLQQQLFQLEWQSLRLIDIWNDLPVAENDAAITLTSQQTLWNALAELTNSTLPVVAFDKATATKKVFNFSHLTTAIQRQKQPA